MPLICVVGPTASGKSALGEAIALALDGEIISADSRQVYKGLDLGSGKEQLKVPQHCLDIAEPGERFTVVDWKAAAEEAIADCLQRGKRPIVVGGTGLYVSALTQDFAFGPELPAAARKKIAAQTTDELVTFLSKENPAALEKLDTRNRRYLERAVEKTRAGWRAGENKDSASPYQPIFIGWEWPREELYERIDARVKSRLKEGMLAEVQGLLDAGVSAEWLKALGLEYRYLTEYIEGRYSSLEEAVERLQFATHHFARRQLIWWRRYDVTWVKSLTEGVEVAKRVI